MRDILPEDEIARKRIISIIEKKYQEYGFDPVTHPAIERLDVLEAKSGEGIKTEIFRFNDEELGLRFDLTVSLARMFSENTSLAMPFKRYSIGQSWRREEPQYGRYREFTQADADILGSKSARCEAELIACACDILDELGIEGYVVYVNNRKMLNAVLRHMGVSEDKIDSAIRCVDKLDKKKEEDVIAELAQNGIQNGKEIVKAFTKSLEYYESIEGCREAVAELKELFACLDMYGVKNCKFDPSIARGLGYYTGIIYEIKSQDKQLGTIAAGGRYDGLVGIYAGQDVPAVGISFGVDRMANLLKGLTTQKTYTKIILINVKEENYRKCVEYARMLRKNGVPARVDLMGRNMKKQLDYASSLGVPYVGIVGDKESAAGEITIKDLSSGDQKTLPINDAIKALMG
ncbi:MAG: histidine--tRNA ligase [Candidatus Micrarchaeota archaeon]|nr:histidine--tRNA ligase [Candidatus Micrarchaeota archaeon]